MKYIYILSERYSGSTLLSFLLSMHEDIATIGERRKFFNKAILKEISGANKCSCGETFIECEFWNAISNQMAARFTDIDLSLNLTEFQFSRNRYLNWLASKWVFQYLRRDRGMRWHPFRHAWSRAVDFNVELVEAILGVANARIFLDSSKSTYHAALLSKIAGFDVHVIWLIRDPRAQVSSSLKYNNWSIEYATRKWIEGFRGAEQMLKDYGIKYRQIKYDELCAHPRKILKSIWSFLDVKPGPEDLDFRSQEQHIMGNYNMRLGKDETIEERSDWHHLLDRKQIEGIEEMTKSYKSYYSATTVQDG